MKVDEEIFILTGKASQKYGLGREKELQLFSLLNVLYHNGAALEWLEYTTLYFENFDMVIIVLKSELCDDLMTEFEDDEDEGD